MNYRKPEVTTLGNAEKVIEILSKPPGFSQDSFKKMIQPAYDLDE